MEQFIGCDAHKKFSVFVAVNEKGMLARRCALRTIDSFLGIGGNLVQTSGGSRLY